MDPERFDIRIAGIQGEGQVGNTQAVRSPLDPRHGTWFPDNIQQLGGQGGEGGDGPGDPVSGALRSKRRRGEGCNRCREYAENGEEGQVVRLPDQSVYRRSHHPRCSGTRSESVISHPRKGPLEGEAHRGRPCIH